MNRWTTLAFGMLVPAVSFTQAVAPDRRCADGQGIKAAGALGAQDYEAAGGSLIRIAPRTPAAASAQR